MKFRLFTPLCAVVCILAGCFDGGSAYPKLIQLNNRYTYWKATPENIFIVSGDTNKGASEVIPSNIDKVARKLNIVFGHVTPYPREMAGSRTPDSAKGYFILDVESGQSQIGMTKAGWSEALSIHGISSPQSYLRGSL